MHYETFSRSPIKDLAIPFIVSLTSNPITLLDGLRIRIFQKAKLAHFSPCVFPSFHFAFIFLLVRVTFTCTTPIIAISSNSLLSFTPADVEIPFRYSNSFISRRAGSLIFFLFTPKVFSGEIRSNTSRCSLFLSGTFSIFTGTQGNSWNDAEDVVSRLLWR